MLLNLLTDPLLPVEPADGRRISVDLPTLFELLGRDAIVGLPFLRPHQCHPWHAFTVQLAALALHRAGEDSLEHGAERWRALLRALTPEWPGDEPWHLVVEDLAAPAFMQPPVPEDTLGGFRNLIAAPDDLDVLITSKNHGVKQGQAAQASPSEWVAALVSLQTTGGFGGAGNYGIARMNGGFATRPGIGLVPEGGPGARWRRDVTLLLRNRRWFLERLAELCDDGHALLWCLPWDGRTSLGIEQLDPWFIEVCRRVRLVEIDGTTAARVTTTSAARIAASAFRGNLADPWIPINKEKDSAAYNSLPSYAVMSEVLFDRGTWVRPLLLDWHQGIDAAPMTARFDVFVRGQGKTEGYHEGQVLVRREHQRFFTIPAESERVARLAREMVENVRTLLGGKVLRTALLALIQGGPEQVKFGDKTATAWADTFLDDADREVDRRFFDLLFRRALDEAGGKAAWLAFLRGLARDTFERAVMAVPLAGARRPRAVAVAERILWGAFQRNFGTAEREETADAA
jgi:CRISPR system Cascade subunit CasA